MLTKLLILELVCTGLALAIVAAAFIWRARQS